MRALQPMKSLRALRIAWLVAPLWLVPMVVRPAYGLTDQTASLLEALSLISGRVLAPPTLAPEVTHDGNRFHVHIPLPKLTAPPNAAIEVSATPLRSGVWDFTDLTFPSIGTYTNHEAADVPPVSVQFKIGQQVAHARVDPTLSLPSPYAVAFSDIALHIDSGAPPADLTVARMTSDGTITGDAGRRVTTQSRTLAENWHLTGPNKAGSAFAVSLRSLDARYDVKGLDRAKADRLREATSAVGANQQATPPIPGAQPAISPTVRDRLRTIIQASAGLLSGFDIEETLHGLRFEVAGSGNGGISEMNLAVAGGAGDGRVAGHFEIGLNDMTLTSVPAYYAPRRVAIKAAISGIPVEPLRRWLEEATEEDPDPAALQAEGVALLDEPGAHAGIDTMLIEAGPLVFKGSVRVRPIPGGSVGLDIHLMAHGLDAMLALVQSDPNVQQIMPVLYIAKGMAKPEGDDLVWDIGFEDGALTVNGIPLGQMAGRSPGSRPPASR